MKRYKFLGTEQIDCICDYCGKQEISKAFIVEDLENGRILKFGSTCIKKALDITMPEIRAEFIMVNHLALLNEYADTSLMVEKRDGVSVVRSL